MKKIALTALVLIAFNIGSIKAQINKGTVLLGVSSTLSLAGTGSELIDMGYSTTHYKSDANGYTEPEPDKTTRLNFLPKTGYFFANNLAAGLDVTLAWSKEKK